jgi:hypothetical protein
MRRDEPLSDAPPRRRSGGCGFAVATASPAVEMPTHGENIGRVARPGRGSVLYTQDQGSKPFESLVRCECILNGRDGLLHGETLVPEEGFTELLDQRLTSGLPDWADTPFLAGVESGR